MTIFAVRKQRLASTLDLLLFTFIIYMI